MRIPRASGTPQIQVVYTVLSLPLSLLPAAAPAPCKRAEGTDGLVERCSGGGVGPELSVVEDHVYEFGGEMVGEVVVD